PRPSAGLSRRPHALFFADRLLTDAEMGALLDAISARARVVVVLDACCSGGFLGEWMAARAGRVSVSPAPAYAAAAGTLVLAASPPEGLAAAARAREALPPFTAALLRCLRGCSSWTALRGRMAVPLARAGFATPLLTASTPALMLEPPFRIAPAPVPARDLTQRNPALPFGR